MNGFEKLGFDNGEVAIVTGAASGIGAETAVLFAQRRARPVLVDLDEGKLAQTAARIEEIGGESLVIAGDLTDMAFVQKVVDNSVAQAGRIDVLCNIAGISIDKSTAGMSADQVRKVLEVNLFAPTFLTQAVGRHWLGVVQAGGRPEGADWNIVNMSSVSARHGNAKQIGYTISKGGIEALTTSIAREWGSKGIRCNAIAPGPIETPMLAAVDEGVRGMMSMLTAVGRLGKPEEIAEAVCFVASRSASYLTGQIISPNGGLRMG